MKKIKCSRCKGDCTRCKPECFVRGSMKKERQKIQHKIQKIVSSFKNLKKSYYFEFRNETGSIFKNKKHVTIFFKDKYYKLFNDAENINMIKSSLANFLWWSLKNN